MNRPQLELLTADNLPDLLEAAVTNAHPLEVMPPVPGPEGWNDTRRQAFRKFHLARSIDTPAPIETTYIIRLDGQAIGAGRLEPSTDGSNSAEAGIWIGRSHRGQGVGRSVLADLVELAREAGATSVIGSTTSDNAASRRLLEGIGATMTAAGDAVHGHVDIVGPRSHL
ncbi:MAG TPA: GNAT family N-acetyltransferase [Mycobacteriales bacterium]|nr:GNAT family N-acetyltransferase [Mycobacteriales bacterium]